MRLEGSAANGTQRLSSTRLIHYLVDSENVLRVFQKLIPLSVFPFRVALSRHNLRNRAK